MESPYDFTENLLVRVPFQNTSTSNVTDEDLVNFFTGQEKAEALYLGSQGLHAEFLTKHKRLTRDSVNDRKQLQSLLKYHQRIKYRCTPFGLFAACSTLSWSNENKLKIDSIFKRSTRLDMHYSVALSQYLAKHSLVKPLLRFYPNSSLSNSGDKLRYTEYFYRTNKRIHQLSEVDFSIYIAQVLESAENGATILTLANKIVDESIAMGEAELFIEDLISNQVLLCELEPSVNGNELLFELIIKLETIFEKHPILELGGIILQLKTIKKKITELDLNKINVIEKYHEIHLLLDDFPIKFDVGKLFQTDLFLDKADSEKDINNKICVDISIQKKLLDIISLLHKLNVESEYSNLKKFMEAFTARYEDQVLSVLEVLDNESGLGYGQNLMQSSDVNNLLEKIYGKRAQNGSTISWNAIEEFLLRKLIDATKSNSYSVSISKTELDLFEESKTILPDSLSVMFSIISEAKGKSEIFFKGASGPSATNLLGRFASGNNEIKQLVEEIAKHEKLLNKGKIIAEIVHLPESRTGNILMRPHFRDYEIAYLSGSNRTPEEQIKLHDLFIQVKNNRVLLWSKKHQKEVLPRMANAHNYSYNALPIYHFLCDLQFQGTTNGLAFGWGNLQREFTFLPRVTIDEVIVFQATWQFKKLDYEFILKAPKENQVKLLFEWKLKWKIPDRIYIADGDNELMLHFVKEQELMIELLMTELKNKNSIILKEFLFDLENSAIKNLQGEGYTNEFIAPLIKKSKTNELINLKVSDTIKRSFIPGSEWLYFKIYCGIKSADRILLEIIEPLCCELLNRGLIEKWFFIRYGDPNNHIRLRFYSCNLKNNDEIMSLFFNSFHESVLNKLQNKIQLDTYERELERYGNDAIVFAESLSYEDSKATLDLLNGVKTYSQDDQLWLIALKSLNIFLEDFNLSLDEKIDFLESLSLHFRNEFGFTGKNKVHVDQKYRSVKKEIEDFLNHESKNDSFSQCITQILINRSKQLLPIVQSIKKSIEKKEHNLTLSDLISSFAHMMMNRIFRSNQRMSETLIYDFLLRFLVSKKAKQQQQQQ